MNKKILVAMIVILSTAVLVTGCKDKKKTEIPPIDANVHSGVLGDKELEVFTFTNTSLTWNDNASNLETIITNNSDEDAYLKGFNVYVYDENDTIVATMSGYIGATIKAHGSRIMSTGHYKNLTNASRIEYEIIK